MLSNSKKAKLIAGILLAAIHTTAHAEQGLISLRPQQLVFAELVCVAGSFGENYGEPGHLLGLGGTNPNLIVIKDKTAEFYYIGPANSEKAFQQYRLNQPFDISFAENVFSSVTVEGDHQLGDYVSYVGPVTSLSSETQSSMSYKGVLQIDSRKLIGSFYLESQDSKSGIQRYHRVMGLLECSKAGVK